MNIRHCLLGAAVAAVLVFGADADTGKAKPTLFAGMTATLCGDLSRPAALMPARQCLGMVLDIAGEAVALVKQY